MRKLTLIGYAPPDGKVGWPSGRLGVELEDLDPRHGVFPNLVMTPLLSTLCYLNGDRQREVLADLFPNVLDEQSVDRRPRRYNTLTRSVDESVIRVNKKTGEPYRSSKPRKVELSSSILTLLGDPEPRVRRDNDLLLVFGHWPISAIMSFILLQNTQWEKKDLARFTESMLSVIVQTARRHAISSRVIPEVIPGDSYAKTGLYLRFCNLADDDKYLEYTTACLREFLDSELTSLGAVEQRINDAIEKIGCLLPLGHNENYQSYNEDYNQIGKAQASFVTCIDPHRLKADEPHPLYWKYVGRIIAARLSASSGVDAQVSVS